LKRTYFLTSLVLVLAVWGCGGDTFRPLPGWGTDLEQGRKQAMASSKPLAILYSAPWSSAASDFAEETLAHPDVRKQLQRFVLVNLDLNLERQKKNDHEVRSVPALVLERPLSAREKRGGSDGDGAEYVREVRKFVQGDCPADYLAHQLSELGKWETALLAKWREAAEKKTWSLDPREAEKLATREKPLATLYSAAWNKDAAEYEEKTVPKIEAALTSKFTLLRVNYYACPDRAKKDGLKGEKDLPALVLGISPDEKLVIPGNHSPELISSFVSSIGSYEKKLEGWSSDPAEIEAVKRADKSGPMVVVLDKATHWDSHFFVRETLGTGEVADRLKGYVKVRLRFSADLKVLKDFNVREADVPCLLVFNSFGKPVEKRTYKDKPESITNLLRSVGGRTRGSKVGG
jgi:hypothetical protein